MMMNGVDLHWGIIRLMLTKTGFLGGCPRQPLMRGASGLARQRRWADLPAVAEPATRQASLPSVKILQPLFEISGEIESV